MIKAHFLRDWSLTILALIAGFIVANAQVTKELPPNFDAYVEKVMKEFEVPGMSIAIVKNNKAVLTKGYGIKQLHSSKKVDEHTLFPIASNSKAFTATLLALLVEEGKITWDSPVINYLPWFRMNDPYVTANITVRDLLVHRSGLGAYAGDLLQFPPSTYSREEIVKKVRFLPLTSSFRNAYAYDNILYLAAGELIKEVTGKEWEECIQDRILKPLGMTTTVSRISSFGTANNTSASHARFDGEIREVKNFLQYGVSDITNPAGGIASNATDMAKWLITQLDSGRAANGHVLYKKTTATELWKGVTPMPVAKLAGHIKPAQMEYQSYALGFYTYNYRSERIVAHGGKLDGFVSRVVMVPSLNLGIAILTNQESGGAIAAIVHQVIDHALKVPAFDWITGYKKEQDANFERIKKVEATAIQERNAKSQPSLPLQKYTGRYNDKWYGDVLITQEQGRMVVNFSHNPGMIGDVEHWQYDTFIVKWRNREFKADAYITFSLNADGTIDHAKMKAVSPMTDASYDFHDLYLKPVTN